MRQHRLGFIAFALVACFGLHCFGQTSPAVSDLRPGIVVEKVEKNSAAEKAGLQEGDTLLSWSREGSRGIFESPFDLSDVDWNERPRGTVLIDGLRGAAARTWTLGPECICIVVSPNFAFQDLKDYRRGELLLRLGKVNQAREYWRRIASRHPGRTWLYPWLLAHPTMLLAGLKRWTVLDRLLNEATRFAGENRNAALLHRYWAYTFATRANSAEAARHFRQAMEIDLRFTGESLAVAGDPVRLAEQSLGHLADATRYLLQAMAIQEKLAPESVDLAYSLICAGVFAHEEGDLSQAEGYLKRALDMEEKLAPLSTNVAIALIGLGTVYTNRDDLVHSERYYRRALSLARGWDPRGRHTALALRGIAEIAKVRGQLTTAEYYEKEALAIHNRSVPNGLDVEDALLMLAAAAYQNHEFSKARRYAWRALLIATRLAPGTLRFASALDQLGQVQLAIGNPSAAERLLEHALAIEEKLAPNGVDAAGTLEDLGDLHKKTGRLSRAEENYRRALAIYERAMPGSSDVAETETGLAEIQRQRRRFDEAATLYERAINVLENLIFRIGSAVDARSGFRAKHQDPYREYIALLVQQHRPDHAFQVLERSRARSLVEMLTSAHVDVSRGADPTLLEQERSIEEKLAQKSNQRIRLLSGDHGDQPIKQLDKEIADLLSEREYLEGQIHSSSPAYAALTQPQSLSAKQIQQQLLDQNTALLEYSLGEEHSYLFVLTPTTLKSYELPDRKKIERAARRVYALLTARNHAVRGETRQQRQARLRFTAQAYQRATRELSRMILDPAAGELQNKRLLIVTDGALAYIPFAALPLPGSSAPLIANHEIIYLPSASALAVLRQQEQGRKLPSLGVAVLADPVFSKNDPRVIRSLPGHELLATNSAPRSAAPQDYDSFEADLPAHLLQRSIGDVRPAGRLRLNRLPYTRLEAHAIVSSVPPGQGLQALDFQASRSTATSPDLAQYRIVHFATHGLLDSRHPELSGLVLSLVGEHGQPQNGFLELQDIYNLNLSADLVVLSACQTALGKEVDGEGLVGLTRGFMYAGASRVMASLWRVDDEATAQLMKKLYEGMLQEGKTPAAALEEAQRWMQGQRKWREPYYWAGFVLQGEWK